MDSGDTEESHTETISKKPDDGRPSLLDRWRSLLLAFVIFVVLLFVLWIWSGVITTVLVAVAFVLVIMVLWSSW